MKKSLYYICFLISASLSLFAYTETDLIRAIEQYNIEAFNSILESGLNPNFLDEGGFSPLALTICLHNRPLFEALIAHGSDINFLSKDLEPPLTTAILEGNLYALNRLLEEGADFSIEREDNMTPLMVTIHIYYLSGVKALCNFNADISSMRNSQGITPLAFAETKRNGPNKYKTISSLLKFGAMEADETLF